MSTAITRVQPSADPYDHTDPRNRLAVHRGDPMHVARQTPVGRMVLGEDSDFLRLAEAAGVNAAALVLELASVAARKPDILKCSQPSMIAFMLDAAKLQLSIGRGIYPVPVKGRLEGWVGYKGAKELACRGGAIRDAWAAVVFEGDEFEMEEVPIPLVTKHRYGPHRGQMAKAIGVYCTLLYPGGRTRMKYFTREKIEAYRRRNSSSTRDDSAWKTAEEEMWMAKAVLHTVGDLPHSSAHMAHLREMLEREQAEALPAAPAAPALPPAATDIEEIPEDPAPEEEPQPAPMALGVASTVPVRIQGGHTRMLGELRNSHLERLRTWAREKLESDPEAVPMQRIAEGCTVLLEARARGEATEPPKKAAA